MKKVLEFGDPYVRCYNHHAFCTGIIKKASVPQEWIYNFFIQVFYKPNRTNKIDFVLDYFFENEGIFIKGYHNIPKVYKDKHEFIEMFKAYIDTNAYICGDFDEYYIPGKKSYLKSHFEHNFLLYGYDDENEIFYSVGYDERYQWNFYHIPYKILVKSLIGDKFINFNSFVINPYFTSEIDINFIRNSILSYLYLHKDQEESFIYGEKGVSEYFNMVSKQIKKGKELHIPSIYALYEQKKMMLERLKLIAQKKSIIINDNIMNEYEDIKNQYTILVNLFIKYSYTKDKKYADHISALSKMSITKERMLLEEISEILKCPNYR